MNFSLDIITKLEDGLLIILDKILDNEPELGSVAYAKEQHRRKETSRPVVKVISNYINKSHHTAYFIESSVFRYAYDKLNNCGGIKVVSEIEKLDALYDEVEGAYFDLEKTKGVGDDTNYQSLKFKYTINDVDLVKVQRDALSQKIYPSEIAFEVEYSSARKILINGIFLSKTRFDSTNDQIFSFVYDHPNKKITRDDIKKSKALTSVLDDLGFKGPLRKLFFQSSTKDAVIFKNPVYKHDLDRDDLREFKKNNLKCYISEIRAKRNKNRN